MTEQKADEDAEDDGGADKADEAAGADGAGARSGLEVLEINPILSRVNGTEGGEGVGLRPAPSLAKARVTAATASFSDNE